MLGTGSQQLEWVEGDKQVQIQHKYDGGEVRIGPRQLPVDGYCAENKAVFQFHSWCVYPPVKNHWTRGLSRFLIWLREKQASDQIDHLLEFLV